MKPHDDAETDSLSIKINPQPDTETSEVVDGITVDLDAEGEVGGFDIDRASAHVDRTMVETAGLPLSRDQVLKVGIRPYANRACLELR